MEKYHTVAPDTDFCISGKPQTDDRDYMLRDVTRTQGMQEVKKGNLDVLVQSMNKYIEGETGLTRSRPGYKI